MRGIPWVPHGPNRGCPARAILGSAGPGRMACGPIAGACLGLVVGTDTRFVGEYQREYHRIDPFASDTAMSRLHGPLSKPG